MHNRVVALLSLPPPAFQGSQASLGLKPWAHCCCTGVWQGWEVPTEATLQGLAVSLVNSGEQHSVCRHFLALMLGGGGGGVCVCLVESAL